MFTINVNVNLNQLERLLKMSQEILDKLALVQTQVDALNTTVEAQGNLLIAAANDLQSLIDAINQNPGANADPAILAAINKLSSSVSAASDNITQQDAVLQTSVNDADTVIAAQTPSPTPSPTTDPAPVDTTTTDTTQPTA